MKLVKTTLMHVFAVYSYEFQIM